MNEIIYFVPKLKNRILKFYKDYNIKIEKKQLIVDLLSNNKVLDYFDKTISKKDSLLTNQGIVNLIKENFYDWTYNQIKKNKLMDKYTNDIKNKAINILNNGSPIEYCLNVLSKKHIGEKHILLLGMFSGISTGFKDRKMLIHLMGVGSSGKGKTDALETVGEIFSNYEPIISASPKNIFYKAGDDMLIDNGILFFPENDIKDLEFQALERVLTDDKDIIPKHETVINQKAKSLEIKQINVMWRNSVETNDDNDNQLNNRYYIFNVDESTDQDDNVFNHILNNWNVAQNNNDIEIKICNCITDLIKNEPIKVMIPYIRGINLSIKDDRRTIKKFLRLINSITYFNKYQRARNNNIIISEIEDFEVANYLWNKINKYESSKLPEYETNIINEICKHKEICVTELSKILNKDISNLNKKIVLMEQRGLIYSEKQTISYFEVDNRVTKPKKLLYTNRVQNKTFRFGSSFGRFGSRFGSCEKDVKMIVQDLEQLNIKELQILDFGFGTIFKVREKKRFSILLKKILKSGNLSHFLKNNLNNNNNNNNNIYIYNIYNNTTQIRNFWKIPFTIPKRLPKRTKTHQNENIDKLDITEDIF